MDSFTSNQDSVDKPGMDESNDQNKIEDSKLRDRVIDAADQVDADNAPDSLEDEIKVLKLRLELAMDEDDREIVRKYGKAKEGIIREIIVPYYYPLHALHYAIQKAFGWQNSHLHHFEFPDEVFEKLTGDSFMKYCMLCGLLFRFPYGDDDMDDIYWDDDYSEGENFKNWLKSKYTAPYIYNGTFEHYMFSQITAKRFWEDHPMVSISPSLAAYMKGHKKTKEVRLEDATCEEMDRFFGGNLGEIIERISIGNVLCSDHSGCCGTVGVKDVGDSTGENVMDAYKGCDRIADDLDEQFAADIEELKRVYSIQEKLKAAKEKMDRLSKRKNASLIHLYRTLCEVQELQEKYLDDLRDLLSRTNAEMPPLCNEIVYKYDYGDDWEVKITCEAEYLAGIRSEDVIGLYSMDDESADGNEADRVHEDGNKIIVGESTVTPMEKELFERIFKQVIVDGNPICVAADGLPVMDDVGGVSGYCDFLKCIKSGKKRKNGESDEAGSMYDDPASSKDWARGMGWTGRMSKPENIL